jgi:hypothetical protein
VGAMQKISAFLVAAVVSIFILQPKSANAVTLTDFYFTGTCQIDCTGTATATLVLQNYTIGNSFDDTILNAINFVSFTYQSDFLGTISFDNSSSDFLRVSGLFNSLPGHNAVLIQFFLNNDVWAFQTFTSGTWCIGIGEACLADFGNNGVWSLNATTPLPSALPLFASGLGALGLLGWRRKKKLPA